MKNYEGYLGKFEYDENQFCVDGRILRYIGKETDGSEIIIPEGVTSLEVTFAGSDLVTPPVIPDGVKNCHRTFQGCSKLVRAAELSEGVTTTGGMYAQCFNLMEAGRIPDSVVNCVGMFTDCYQLKEAAVCGVNAERCCMSMYGGCVSLEKVYDVTCTEQTTGMYADCYSIKLSDEQLDKLRTAGLLNSLDFANTFIDCTRLLEKTFVPVIAFHSLLIIGGAAKVLGLSKSELIEKWIMPFVRCGILPAKPVDFYVSEVDKAAHTIYFGKNECSFPNEPLTQRLFDKQLAAYRTAA